ncbi:MAG TPA: amino acid decarboxylase, partial [Aliiroseovarius sp.]|nr:amino acid decarboxylase [Aliiroseovarius sp.]
TSGTSQATILALNAARFQLFGGQVRRDGITGLPPVAVYAAAGAHTCIGQALEVMGHGAAALRQVPAGPDGMDVAALSEMLAQDQARGIVPLAIVATAGSVNTGVFDAIDDIADICAAQGIWLHVDAAFGFWTLLADAPWAGLAAGMGRAQSVALDFHKWVGVPYAAGACLVRDREVLRATFVARPDYLSQGAGLAGGEPWFTDYGVELSRGFAALKVWAVVKTAGTDALGAAISDNCRQAALMGRLVEAAPKLRLAHEVVSNICCFEPLGAEASAIAARLQIQGQAVFSTTRIDGVTCLRAAIVNHRSTADDIRAAIRAVEEIL